MTAASKRHIRMSKHDTFGGRTLIYSNRPPTAGSSGGAQAVIEASNPTWWVGPEAVDDKFWNVMEEHEREVHRLHGNPDAEEKAGYDVLTFATPKSLEEAQYKTISNEILWPVAHSMQPNTDKTIEEIEDAYFHGYLPHNELGNLAIRNMVDEHGLDATDRIWVHDYQCTNVPGMVYSSHIPWPGVEFLETVSFPSRSGQEVKLLDSNFFHDYIELMSSHALSTFQRPVDQANFILTAARVAGSDRDFALETANPALQNLARDVQDSGKVAQLREELLKEIDIGTPSTLMLFGDNITVLNVPVGQVTENTHEEALENAHKLNKTRFKHAGDAFSIFNADMGGGRKANLTASNPADFDRKHPPLLKDLVAPIRGRDWVLSVHRNDYTKGTLTKLEAAEQVLAENPNATFLFILQPTREDVGGYKEYAERVFHKAADLRGRFGDKSVVIIPEAVQHNDIMGLMRQPEMRGFMGLGHKDGHDLTVREVVDANDPGTAIGVITSSGIGASDVLGGKDSGQGSFVIRNPNDATEVAEALNTILSPAYDGKLRERFDFMKARSQRYDAANFSATVDAVYPAAMAHRYGPGWEKSFQQPDGHYTDRMGEITTEAAEQERAAQYAAAHPALPDETARPGYVSRLLQEQTQPAQGMAR